MGNKKLLQFKCEVYNFNIIVSFHSNYKQLKKELEKISKDDKVYNFNSIGSGACLQFDCNTFFIWIKEDTPGIRAHEIFHCVHFMMDEIECVLNDDTKEPYAYLIEYITDKIYKFKK